MKISSKQKVVSSRNWSLVFVFFLLATYHLLPTTTQAQSVDLLWYAEGYTPPFYQGASLWAKQGEIKFVAIPQGLGNPANLNYRWTRNGTVLGLVSGVGINTLSFLDTVFSKPQRVSVEIVSDTDEVLASASANILPTNSEILVYENSPLYGILYHREAGVGQKIRDGEITLEAVPLFFTITNKRDPALLYTWRASGAEPSQGSSVTYRAPEGSGSSLVSIQVSNQQFFNQNISRNLRLEF